ncbi:MAG TPA: rhodanese-like domain-containing protein [Candidatus Cybelea sp.]|jgi:rhodanese-related sulfurtransferase|nr:rhodanese-like domain-containing protein [Candidatus Cybelea sp.]
MDDMQISVKEVNERVGRGDKLLLVDVREQWEYDLSKIPGAKLIPLGTLPAKLDTLLEADEVICYCHHGMRSLDAVVWLRQQGVENAKSMAGGIERWSVEVDPQVPRY